MRGRREHAPRRGFGGLPRLRLQPHQGGGRPGASRFGTGGCDPSPSGGLAPSMDLQECVSGTVTRSVTGRTNLDDGRRSAFLPLPEDLWSERREDHTARRAAFPVGGRVGARPWADARRGGPRSGACGIAHRGTDAGRAGADGARPGADPTRLSTGRRDPDACADRPGCKPGARRISRLLSGKVLDGRRGRPTLRCDHRRGTGDRLR